MTKRKPKFQVGQVVCILDIYGKPYERILEIDRTDGQVRMDSGWFLFEDARPLTARECGRKRGKR